MRGACERWMFRRGLLCAHHSRAWPSKTFDGPKSAVFFPAVSIGRWRFVQCRPQADPLARSDRWRGWSLLRGAAQGMGDSEDEYDRRRSRDKFAKVTFQLLCAAVVGSRS